ncbi:hypothetical protein EMCRGX_G018891 [Ephydatia muelleri]
MGVQRYYGGTSVQHDKPIIHQPGTLRKHVGSSELGSIVNAPDLGNTTSFYDLKDFTLLLPPGITLSTIGHFAYAVDGADGKVINLCFLHCREAIFSSDAVLLVDAMNAFNQLYRQAALHNIRYLCPSIATVIINTYREPTDLFVDGNSILSQEGTTQGNPLAMPMHALAILPLIRRIADNVQEAWYADDGTATGSLKNLRTWWDKLVTVGPSYGYFVNAVKTWLITKEETHTRALDIFKDTQIRITKEGKPHLGAALGTSSYIIEFVKAKVKNCKQMGLCGKNYPQHWLLQPLEELLRTKFIPSLTGRAAPSDLERELLALPARLGSLGLLNPSYLSTTEYSASMKVTQPLVNHIIKQDETYGYEILQDQLSAKAEFHKSKREQHSNAALILKDILPPSLAHAMDLSQEKGASTWLSVLPLEEYGFALHKGAFRDALALRYGWSPANAPLNCACGTHFSVVSCPKGGASSTTHDSHENEKKRKYDQRIREVEHASFTPLILSCTGGLGPQATTSYKRPASLLSTKWNQAYSLTIMWLRCRLAYSLLRSSVMCIRGARSHLGHYTSATQPPLDLVSREALLLAQ